MLNKLSIAFLVFIVPVLSGANSYLEFNARKFQNYEPLSRVHLLSRWDSLKTSSQTDKKNFELELDVFAENGEFGDWSLELDPAVYRFQFPQFGHLWIGRTHPLVESSHLEDKVFVSSAVGSLWGQNTVDPLSPRVSGWIGAGLHLQIPKLEGLYVTAAYSPIFIPGRSPKLNLADQNDRALFARTLPAAVSISDNAEPLPIKYDLQIDSISDIVMQGQGYFALSYMNKSAEVHLLGWRSPSPDPIAQSKERLVIEEDPYVLVRVKPDFPMRSHLGLDMKYFWEKSSGVDYQIVYTQELKQLDSSLAFYLNQFIQVGLGHRIYKDLDEDDPLFYSSFTSGLVWGRVSYPFLDKKMLMQLEYNQHVLRPYIGNWVRTNIYYNFSKQLALNLGVQVITGEDKSYYGDWRSFDSIETGMRYLW